MEFSAALIPRRMPISGDANSDYQTMEADLQTEIDRVRTTHPGYDEYQFDLANINHNPYVLTSYLTVLYEGYTREEVRDKLRELFDAQYQLTYREKVQIRTRTEERTGQRTVVIDPRTGETATEEYTYEVEAQYEYRILHVKLVNNTLEACIDQSSLSEVQKERFLLLNQTRGNREYLFAAAGVLIIVIGGIAIWIFLQAKKKKKPANQPDPDADYREDEDGYDLPEEEDSEEDLESEDE